SNPAADITPADAAFRSRGGIGRVTASSATTCPWTATSNSDFVTITASNSGGTSGTVDYQVAPNAGAASRTGTLSIAGRTFSVTQSAATPENSQTAASLSTGGSRGFSTPGTSDTVEAGEADVTLDTGKSSAERAAQLSQVWGTAVFSLKQNNTVVSEAGVPASPPTTAARIFIDYRSGIAAKSGAVEAGTISVNTGIGIVNKGSNAAHLIFTLRDESGAVAAVGHGTLPTGNHRAVFIDQLSQLAPDFTMPAGFASTTGAGTLQIQSDQPVSVVALRLTTNQRGETLMTSVPVADETRTLSGTTVYFPQVADGGGYQTEIVLMNPTGTAQTGQIRFYTDDGGPLTLHRAGDTGVGASSFNYTLLPGGCYLLRTDGVPASVHAGSAQVVPDAGTSVPVGVGLFAYTPLGNLFGSKILVTESGIPSAPPTTHALVYVDQTKDHLTGLALAAVDGAAIRVTLKALAGDGTTIVGTGSVDLSGNGHAARFVNELITGLPPNFAGVLELTAPTSFAALTLRGLSNTRGEFLLTTFPVADFNQPSPTPIVFPQIADGGGYHTEIILLNTGGQPVSLKISFFGEDGLPLDVAK
ncbi:MAG: BACON domain-containing protein, partial [Terriglobia bacterium]